MSDDQIGAKLNLDAEGFTSSIESALKSLYDLQKMDLKDLTNSFKDLVVGVGGIATAVYLVKKTLDFTIEAEQIRTLQNEFQNLAKQANISADTLIEGLKKSSDGLMDETELMKLANEAIVKMGNSAKRLPELLEMSRKAAVLTGTDMTTQFKNMEMAIVTGNERMIKRLGLHVDLKKAEADYAAQHKTIVEGLSEEEKAHVRLQAILAAGKEKFKDVSLSTSQTKDSMTRLTVAISEFKEAFAINISQIVGPAWAKTFGEMRGFVESLARSLKMNAKSWGQDLEQTDNQLEDLQTRLSTLKLKLSEFDEKGPGFFTKVFGDPKKEREKLVREIDIAEAETKGLMQRRKELEDKSKSDVEDKQQGPKEDAERRLTAHRKMNEEKLKIDEEYLKEKEKEDENDAQVEATIAQELANEKIKYEDQVEQYRQEHRMKANQSNEELVEMEKTHQLKIQHLQEQTEHRKLKALDAYEKHALTSSQKMSRAMTADSKRDEKALKDWGATGHRVRESFKKHSIETFKAVGEGARDSQALLKSLALNTIADEAEAKGEFLLGSSIWPPNPVGLAAGGGLIALAAALRSQAGGQGGGSGSSSSGGDSGGGGGGGGASALDSSSSAGPDTVASQPKKSVTVQIMGHVFDSQESGTRIAEMIRQTADATDYVYKPIGTA